MCPNLQETADLVTFTEKTLDRKLHFLSSVKFHYGFLNYAYVYNFYKKSDIEASNTKPNQFSMSFSDKKTFSVVKLTIS